MYGIRFFGTDYNNQVFNGTITVSSADDKKEFAFDGLKYTRWTSDGEDTDGDQVTLEMDYGFNRTVDSFYIFNTNIEDVEVQYWTGLAWATVNSSIATITKSSDLFYYHAKLNSSVTAQKIRIVGEDTITPNQEKYVTLFHAFMELGQLEYFPVVESKFNPYQDVFKTTSGLNFIIERGEAFEAIIKFKSHVNQNDIDLVQELLARKEPFYIWLNGGNETIFTYTFRPYLFSDIFKVAIIGGSTPMYTKNYYKAGYNDTLNLVEVS